MNNLFEEVFELFNSGNMRLMNSNVLKPFLPYNIYKNENNEFVFELAVAGYGKDQLEVSYHNGVLDITGKNINNEKFHYYHKGLTGKSFKFQFPFSPSVQVKNVNLKDGLLKVIFEITATSTHSLLPINEG